MSNAFNWKSYKTTFADLVTYVWVLLYDMYHYCVSRGIATIEATKVAASEKNYSGSALRAELSWAQRNFNSHNITVPSIMLRLCLPEPVVATVVELLNSGRYICLEVLIAPFCKKIKIL